MSPLSVVLRKTDFARNLKGALEVVQKTTGSVSFFGTRLLSSNEATSTVDFNALCNKTLKAVRKRVRADNLSLEERRLGLALANRIEVLYEQTQEHLKKRNCLTRALCTMREHLFPIKKGYTTKILLHEITQGVLKASGQAFKRLFEAEPRKEQEFHPAIDSPIYCFWQRKSVFLLKKEAICEQRA